jgi:predicted house-cleaning noncanonical NTP pyrophosphatase (MazG superfamily)
MKKKKVWQLLCPDCGGVLAESENHRKLIGVEYTCDGPHDEPLTFIGRQIDLMQKREIIYKKLVRDRIPEIIKADGAECVTHIAKPDEYKRLLEAKLQEEVTEFLHNKCAEEIADILEVIEAIARLEGISVDEIKKAKTDKRTNRGSFNKRIVLETTNG